MPEAPRESASRESAERPTSTTVEASGSTRQPIVKRGRKRDDEEPETAVNGADSAASEAPDAPREPESDPSADEGEDPSSPERSAPDADLPSVSELALDGLVPDDARLLHHAPEDREIDAELVRRAQTGDHAAFRQLFDRYHKRVYAVAFGVLKNRHDALDCVQEGFVKVHRHLPNFQGSSSFYTWLYRIVMNLAIDQLRRRKTAKPVEFDETRRRDSQEPGDDAIVSRLLDENPRKAVIRRELLERVQAALAELPEYHRQVILLREIEGMSYEEMAEALEVPKGTIMSRLFHARKKMQEALKGYVDGDLDIEE
jgi:RNA polymerase sigma-70 factor (ECF subfamily)